MGEQLEESRRCLHGRLVALEIAASRLATDVADEAVRRDLDNTAAAFIRLRSTLEANVRLRDADRPGVDRTDPDPVLTASDDLIAVACEDLRIDLHQLFETSGCRSESSRPTPNSSGGGR